MLVLAMQFSKGEDTTLLATALGPRRFVCEGPDRCALVVNTEEGANSDHSFKTEQRTLTSASTG